MNNLNTNKKTEGDINLTSQRTLWNDSENDEETKHLLEKDARYFLHQAMSTPCLDVLESCEGASIKNITGKTYLDFHGNHVHPVGYANPKFI